MKCAFRKRENKKYSHLLNADMKSNIIEFGVCSHKRIEKKLFLKWLISGVLLIFVDRCIDVVMKI